MQDVDCDVLVVGGGISGLVIAFELQQRGLRVEVFEAASRAGGVIGTVQRDGARYELGPNSALDNTPLIDDLLRRLGLADERVDASALATQRFVVRDGRLVALPMTPGAFIRSNAFTTRAKMRLLQEPFIAAAPRATEESIAAFARRRLGTEFLDYAVDPFVAGIYAGDPENISVPAAFPRLHALEQRYGSLIKGQLAARRDRPDGPIKPPRGKSFSFRSGMQALPDALAHALTAVRRDATVKRIRNNGDGTFSASAVVAGETINRRATAMVIGTPADAAATLIEDIDRKAAQTLRTIAYSRVSIVASLYRRDTVRHPLDGFGFLVPRREDRRILGCLFSSSLFAHRAPPQTVLLTTFAGGLRNPEIAQLDDELMAGVVVEELASLLGATAAPEWQEVTRWPRAIPQYTLGHIDRLRIVQALEMRMPGLFFCASYRGGVAIGDRIACGHAIATRIAQSLV